jgi:hypothetical protein
MFNTGFNTIAIRPIHVHVQPMWARAICDGKNPYYLRT